MAKTDRREKKKQKKRRKEIGREEREIDRRGQDLLVVDLGSHTCKAGYAGEDAPKAVFPSVVGAVDGVEPMDVDVDSSKKDSNSEDSKSDKEKSKRKLYVGSQALNYRRDHMEILSPIKDGVVSDWDLVDNIWEHAFRSCLMIDPKEHPMLLAEPPLNTNSRERRRQS
ncbi:Actin-related protein 4 [Raphanus sativus]|nr:Actin-related protein 4 [Raphanus sativus]